MLNVFWECLPGDTLPIIDSPDEGQDVWTWSYGKPVKAHVGTKYVILPVTPFPVPLEDTYKNTPYDVLRRKIEDTIAKALATIANTARHQGDFRVLERRLDWQTHGRLPTLYAAVAMIPKGNGLPTQRISYIIKSHLK